MIDAEVDAIIVDRRLVDRARSRHRRRLRQGHRHHQFRQPRRHQGSDRQDQHRSTNGASSAAKWLVEQLDGKGKILVLNGPAGVSVSDDRRKGAEPVLKANPGHQDPGRDQHALQRRAGAGSGHQPAVRQPRDRRGLAPGRGALGGRGDRIREAGPRAGSDHRRELSASSSRCGSRRAHRLGDAAAELARRPSPSMPP